jgi:hypothetical protein
MTLQHILQNIDTTNIQLVTASSNRQYNTYRRPGGTLLLTQGHTMGRCQITFSDKMGRRCSTTYSGPHGRQFYQLTTSATANQSRTLPTQQQYSIMVEKGLPLDWHPRQQFCLDLTKYIANLKNNGHLILLMHHLPNESCNLVTAKTDWSTYKPNTNTSQIHCSQKWCWKASYDG